MCMCCFLVEDDACRFQCIQILLRGTIYRWQVELLQLLQLRHTGLVNLIGVLLPLASDQHSDVCLCDQNLCSRYLCYPVLLHLSLCQLEVELR